MLLGAPCPAVGPDEVVRDWSPQVEEMEKGAGDAGLEPQEKHHSR